MSVQLISAVVPVMNEIDSVPKLYEQLRAVADGMSCAWEFVIVDDGSTDGTWEALVALHERDVRFRAIRFKRNFGQTPAMACGIDHAQGDVIVTMDGDLQNDPADIPRLVAKLDEGYDVVCGWRYQRQDKLWTRRVPSLIANRMIGWITGVRLHDYGCSLKAYRAAAIKRTPLYAELHRFIPAMATLTGAQIVELKVNHRAREFGQTKYNLWRTWKVALDMITVSVLVKFAGNPLRLFGTFGFSIGVVAAMCALRVWPRYAGAVGQMPQVAGGTTLLLIWLAGHLLVVGLLGELLLATAHTKPAELVAIQKW